MNTRLQAVVLHDNTSCDYHVCSALILYLGHFSKVDQTISVPSLDVHLKRVDLIQVGPNVWQCTGLLARERRMWDGY